MMSGQCGGFSFQARDAVWSKGEGRSNGEAILEPRRNSISSKEICEVRGRKLSLLGKYYKGKRFL